MHIGLLEDDIAIQEMLLLVLQDEGYTVTNYSNAEACLKALVGSGSATRLPASIDLLIIDWRLGGTRSGIEVIRLLRASETLQSLPIILTTAAAFSDAEELQQLDVALLEKPFSVEEVTSLIERLMQPSSAANVDL